MKCVRAAASVLTVGIAMTLAGCNTYLARHAPRSSFAPLNVTPVGMDVFYAPHKGTLWQERGRENNLFSDHIARKVNDIVHVIIVEQTEAFGEAKTSTTTESSSKAGMPNAFGLLAAFAAKNTFFDVSPMLQTELSRSFAGDGATSRKGSLKAEISARIIELLPNKHYRIEGRQHITVNNEEQYLVVQGIIREEDITPNNTVLSTNIADQKTWYTRRGILAEKQRPGWLGPIFDIFWPF